jgi:Na+-transporting methylmalonyl-CoA/oxaloacetate decarboxylase beta subunit
VRLFRLFVDLVISAVCAGLVAGFLTGVLITFVAMGIEAIVSPAILFIGLFGAAYALMFASPVALLLGAALWTLRLHHWLIWAGAGALTGLIYYIFLWRAADGPMSSESFTLAAVQLFSGACSALVFRLAMRTLRAETDDL